MTPAEHYEEAERVRRAIRTPHDASEQGFDGWQRDDLIALAQLHATLALYTQPATTIYNVQGMNADEVHEAARRIAEHSGRAS